MEEASSRIRPYLDWDVSETSLISGFARYNRSSNIQLTRIISHVTRDDVWTQLHRLHFLSYKRIAKRTEESIRNSIEFGVLFQGDKFGYDSFDTVPIHLKRTTSLLRVAARLLRDT